MRSRWLPSVALALAFVAAPGIAAAEEPPDFGSSTVVDSAGVLGARASEVEAAIDRLADEAGINLIVAFVDTFEDPSDRVAWADQTADLNQLGEQDILLAVAVDDRLYQPSFFDGFPLSDGQLADVEERRLLPALRDGDWAGAAIGYADGLREASAGGGFPTGWLIGGVAAAAAVGGGVYLARRRRTATSTTAAEGPSQAELDKRAAAALIALDDAVSDSEQELGFAIAQFGEETTTAFAQALTSAKAKRQEAFQLQQRLDDSSPETPQDRRAGTERIIALCAEADAELDAQADAFDELRALETNAPQAIAQERADLAAVEPRLLAAASTLDDLVATYSPAAVTAVAGNVDQARQLVTVATSALDGAERSLASNATSGAAVAVRGAQATIDRIAALLEAVERRAQELGEARTRLDAAIRDARQDLSTLPDDPALASASAALAAALDDAERTGARDPLTAIDALDRADDALDRALGEHRDRAERIRRQSAMYERTVERARAQLAAAQSYLSTRRGGVEVDARTRLVEAERLLTLAVTTGTADQASAMQSAQQSYELSSAALTLARQDVDRYVSRWPDDGYGSDYRSAELGGLADWLFSGGSDDSDEGWWGGGSSGGWGGSSRSGGWSGSSRRSSSRRSSGFGAGFGGSSRRSGGGSRSRSSGRGGRF